MKLYIPENLYSAIEAEITEISVPTVAEAQLIPEKLRSYPSIWWLSSPGRNCNHAAFVHYDGHINAFGTIVNDEYTMRPVLRFNPNFSNLEIDDEFTIGPVVFRVITENFAFCLSDIGSNIFDKYDNTFDSSNLKNELEKWLIQNISR